jgi:hypothetical protein
MSTSVDTGLKSTYRSLSAQRLSERTVFYCTYGAIPIWISRFHEGVFEDSVLLGHAVESFCSLETSGTHHRNSPRHICIP